MYAIIPITAAWLYYEWLLSVAHRKKKCIRKCHYLSVFHWFGSSRVYLYTQHCVLVAPRCVVWAKGLLLLALRELTNHKWVMNDAPANTTTGPNRHNNKDVLFSRLLLWSETASLHICIHDWYCFVDLFLHGIVNMKKRVYLLGQNLKIALIGFMNWLRSANMQIIRFPDQLKCRWHHLCAFLKRNYAFGTRKTNFGSKFTITWCKLMNHPVYL